MRTSIGRVVALALLASSCASAKEETTPAPTAAREIVSGSARVRGGGMRMDVQLGKPFAQRAIRNGTVVVEPRSVVTR